jgi:hypothetical protein
VLEKSEAQKIELLQRILRLNSQFKEVFGRDFSVGFAVEMLIAQYLDLTLVEGQTHKGYDAIDNGGSRYQIKYRALSTPNVFMNNFDFDYVVLANLTADYQLQGIWQMPVHVAQEIAYKTTKCKYRISQSLFKKKSTRIL